MRFGSDPTDEELASMTAAELEAWTETQAVGPWTPNDAASAVAPATTRLTVHLPGDLAAELEAEAARRRQPAQRYARDLLLLALRQVQVAGGTAERAPTDRGRAASPPLAPSPLAPVPLTAEALCARYLNRIYRFAAMTARNPHAADRLARMALRRAVRALPDYDVERGDVEGWLWPIVADAARRRMRPWPWQRRDRHRPAIAPDEAALLAAVRTLPARPRVAIALWCGADLDLRSVAAAVRVTETAARGLVDLGLRRLHGPPGDVERRLRAMSLHPPPGLQATVSAASVR